MGYLSLLVGASLLGSVAFMRHLKRAKIKQAAQASFESYKARQYMSAFTSPMTQREAYLILGLKENSPKDKIMSAHKKLMLLNHPDNGGSTYIATKVNEAKELLLEKVE
jgi:hypothetical protein